MRKTLFILLPWLLLIVTGSLFYRQCSVMPDISFEREEDRVVINHHTVVEKIESMGKLELVKYYIKDIVEHKEMIDWWPDSKAVLIVSGEVVGCLDLTRLDTSDIYFQGEGIHVVLPDPEVCYHKVNHQDSKVYDVKSFSIESFFPLNSQKSNAELIDKAYKHAEMQLQKSAAEMQILEQTKANARLVLKPLLENFSSKKITFSFKSEGYVPPALPAEETDSVDLLQ